jgi:hypothetical protein
MARVSPRHNSRSGRGFFGHGRHRADGRFIDFKRFADYFGIAYLTDLVIKSWI